MERRENTKLKMSSIKKPKYKLTDPNTLIFLTGAPLSGKSTIAPLITSAVEDLALQPMDIIRLLAQRVEETKPEKKKNPFVNYGSCDSYSIVGDGSYSRENLIKGFNLYSEAVCSLLTGIIPKLESQGVLNLFFEGVQLTPHITAPYLDKKNKLIVLKSNKRMFTSNIKKVFGNNKQMLDRYSPERLMIIQEEIITQSKEIPDENIIYVNNTGDYTDAVMKIIDAFKKTKIITPT